MPKEKTLSASSTPRSAADPFQNAQVLRRNQACHQCRRRKLKCDAKRPCCSTCLRSHAYAVAHASPGTSHPPHPECTFDEVQVSEPTVVDTQESEQPKNKIEQLENRILELETLLREKDRASSQPTYIQPENTLNPYEPASLFLGFSDVFGLGPSFQPDVTFPVDSMSHSAHLSPGSSLDDLAGLATLLDNSAPTVYPQNIYPGPDIMNPSWPRNLPQLPVLRLLVDAFFNYTPLADRLFHAATFRALLSLPHTHPKFPHSAVLHAMCAMGSTYTSAIAPTPSGEPSVIDELGDGFADSQIRAAKQAVITSLRTTSDIFESLQAHVIMALWYWYNARWSEACVTFAVSLRYAVPCGLNVCPPFDSISCSTMSRASVIRPATNAVEEEMRRNTFWIAYMTERQFVAINNFAVLLDDQDVCQMLPVRAAEFEQGIPISPRDRQWSHEPGVITDHIDGQVDSFILHVKSTMLLSRVKSFNCRYKSKHHLGDPAMTPDPKGLPGIPRKDLIQTTPAFMELDKLIFTFLDSFPPNLKDPVANGQIDVSLLTALSCAHFAVILLHEAHAIIALSSCISACRTLAAARAILNMLHEAYTTSRNLATLGVFPMVCWFAAGRVLIRFLRSAIDAKSEEHISALRVEVDFIRSVVNGIGDSLPHAYYYGKMLNDFLAQTCGKEYLQPVNHPAISHH